MKISFVIPTLNFAEFIGETLDSIVDEGWTETEIVVFDGGSNDDTLDVLSRYRETKFSALKVVCATERGNIDIDLNLATSHATGDYVWTLSADDVLMTGWSGAIGEELARGPDIILAPAVHCDIAMRPRRSYPILAGRQTGPLRRRVENDRDLRAYLEQVRNSEGVFSFCSACLVRRDRLLEAPLLEAANGTCWRYSARLISILVDYPASIAVLHEPLIYKRGDNDSFGGAGPIRRLRIATESWDKAISALDLGGEVSGLLARRAKSDIRPTSLLYLSQFTRDEEEQRIFEACVKSRLATGQPLSRAMAWTITRFPKLQVLKRALLVARPAWRRLQQRRWEGKLTELSGS